MLSRLRPILKSLHDHEVRYVTIGGIAAILHGVARLTLDLDILVQADEENARRVLDAFREAGFGTAFLLEPGELLKREIVIFEDRVRVDVQTVTPGLSFEKAWKDKLIRDFHGQPIFIASREDLISSKRAAGRDVDLQDIRALEASSDRAKDQES